MEPMNSKWAGNHPQPTSLAWDTPTAVPFEPSQAARGSLHCSPEVLEGVSFTQPMGGVRTHEKRPRPGSVRGHPILNPTVVSIPIRSDDDQRLVHFHDHVSDRSCYLRFFSLGPHLSSNEVERFTRVDDENRLALVAELDDRLIGVARYDRHPESNVAEVAFVVADDYQHHGIGSFLMR